MKKSLVVKVLAICIILFMSNITIIKAAAEVMLSNNEIKTIGKINNIVVFLKFAGEEDVYNNKYKDIKNLFNNEARSSLKHYLNTMSYNKLTVNSVFYPLDENGNICACEVNNDVSYYEKFSEYNPNGYSDYERSNRERDLLIEALAKIENQIPEDLNIDHDNDGVVDSIVFVQPKKSGWGEILWPHEDDFENESFTINGKKLGSYVMIPLEDLNSYGLLAHEYLHILGLNDLYAGNSQDGKVKTTTISTYNPEQSIIYESIMSSNSGILTNYERKKLSWIEEIKTLNKEGIYTLIPSVLNEKDGDIAYKIPIPYDSSRYFILEYRAKGITEYDYEYSQGLFIYGVDENVKGNILSPPYEVYSMSDFNRENYKDYQNSYIAQNDYGIAGYEDYLKKGFNAFTLNDGRDNLGISISNVSFAKGQVTFKLTLDKEKTIEAPKELCEAGNNGSEVKLVWKSQEYFIDEYWIYRDGILIGKTKDKEYSDKFTSPLSKERVYKYSVKAVSKKYGESQPISINVAVNNDDCYETNYPPLEGEDSFMETEDGRLEIDDSVNKDNNNDLGKADSSTASLEDEHLSENKQTNSNKTSGGIFPKIILYAGILIVIIGAVIFIEKRKNKG